MKNVAKNWHAISLEEVFTETKSREGGLTILEADERLKKFGLNVLPQEKPYSKIRLFLNQLNSPLIYILIIAGVITVIFKEYNEAIIIFGAVFINTIVGFIQENKANRTLKELKKMVRHTAKVIRSGNFKIVDSSEVVPGDVVILDSGDKVPADGRIIDTHDLKINEMALTGEWLPAKKNINTLRKATPLADRDNMAYMSCAVEEGKGKILVTEIGANTEIGKIATLLKEVKEEKTPYQKRLAHFSKIVGVIIGIICFAIFTEGLLTHGDVIEMLIVVVAVAVAAIPEGLPVAMTVILALGMQKILKKRGLVRRLSSAETLGSTSIIATDKTGTLTEGKMKVAEGLTTADILRGEKKKEDNLFLFKVATACSEAFVENQKGPIEKWVVQGRPTDKALFSAGARLGLFKEDIRKKEPLLSEISFSSVYKFSASFHKFSEKEAILYVIGAPEKILSHSDLDNKSHQKIQKKLEELTLKGFRVVASAYKKSIYAPDIKIDSSSLYEEIEGTHDLIFSGFIILEDPIRIDVKKTIDTYRNAGIRTIIITGDHKFTAKSVAERLGFKIGKILEGKDLDKLSDEEFDEKVADVDIYARVEPKHKMRIIEAWQRKGEVIAMTGDGVNDAPALKKANIGVALGSGTEVAKEASDLILLDDSFSIIVAAVEEGRGIVDNIRKVITYLLSSSFTESILIGVSIFMGLPLPVTAVQILWVNLIEDGLPNIALSFEPKEKDLMKKKPIRQNTPLLTQEMRVIIFIIGLITDFLLLGLFFWLLRMNYPLEYLRTMIFALLAIDSIFYVFSCKSLRRNIWHINIFDNKFLLFSWLVGTVALVSAIYVPFLNNLLGTVPLYLSAWYYIIGLGLINVILIEIVKFYFITGKRKELDS